MDLFAFFARDQREWTAESEGDAPDRLRKNESEVWMWESSRAGERYRSVEEYDPVLRWHCRIPE